MSEGIFATVGVGGRKVAVLRVWRFCDFGQGNTAFFRAIFAFCGEVPRNEVAWGNAISNFWVFLG